MMETIVPYMHESFTEANREIYLKQMKEAGISAAVLVVYDLFVSDEEQEKIDRRLRETVPFLTRNGIRVCIWVGHTVGHGSLFAVPGDEKASSGGYTPLVNLDGEEIGNTVCPLDPGFRKALPEKMRHLADVVYPLGVRRILIDDDFRLSLHGEVPCCACERHLERIRKICGKPVRREDLRWLVFGGPTNEYRKAWLRAQGDSLRELAAALRESVADYGDLLIAPCASPSHMGWDGIRTVELANILAGQNPPVLRAVGAPYWNTRRTNPFPVSSTFEYARVTARANAEGAAEIWMEGDAYPRPRTITPAALLNIHDAVMRADGVYTHAFKYMADYTSGPEFETGYFEHHIDALPSLNAITEAFAGKKQTGVRVWFDPDVFASADFSRMTPNMFDPIPHAGNFLAGNAIPTVYDGSGIATAVFGEHARTMDRRMLRNGGILDAVAAMALTERGIDVGIRPQEMVQRLVYRIDTEWERAAVRSTKGSFLSADLLPGAEVVATAVSYEGEFPLAIRYENADGERFLIWTMAADSFPLTDFLFFGYLQQEILQREIPRLSGHPIPAVSSRHPGLYLLAAEDGDSLTVGLFNCSVDSILHPEVTLSVRPEAVRFTNCGGSFRDSTVRLDAPLPAYGFAAITARKPRSAGMVE